MRTNLHVRHVRGKELRRIRAKICVGT